MVCRSTIITCALLQATGCLPADLTADKYKEAPMADLITVSEHKSSSGGGLLNESRKAFQELESYKGIIKTTAVVSYPDRVWRESRTYDVSYRAPDSLVFQGTDSNNNALTIVCNGTEVQVVSAAAQTGVLPAPSSAKEALWTYSGVTVRATIMLPSSLLGIQWHCEGIFLPRGDLLSAFATKAELEGVEDVGGHECHRVVCRRDIGTWVFYLDSETHLLRRLDETATVDQIEVQRQFGGGGLSGRIISTAYTHVFEIEDARQHADAPAGSTTVDPD